MYALIQHITSGDVFVIDATDHSRMTEALHYSDWQTDDQLDTTKIESATWNLDCEPESDFYHGDYRWLHEWNG